MTSREVAALIAYVEALVPDAVISAILGRYVSPQDPCAPHSRTSLHCAEGTDGKGLAVDWGGTPAQQRAVFDALSKVAPQLAELIHNSAGITRAVKNGKWVDPLSVYGATVWAAHTNHTHSAVPRGTFLVAPAKAAAAPELTGRKVFPMYEPPLDLEPIVAELRSPDGGVWLLAGSGAVYAFGGAPFLGAPRGKDYFEGRKAARLEPVDGKYAVVAESGERYGPGF